MLNDFFSFLQNSHFLEFYSDLLNQPLQGKWIGRVIPFFLNKYIKIILFLIKKKLAILLSRLNWVTCKFGFFLPW